MRDKILVLSAESNNTEKITWEIDRWMKLNPQYLVENVESHSVYASGLSARTIVTVWFKKGIAS